MKKKKFGVVVFPGSNCDADCLHVLKNVLGQEARFVWHKETSLGALDAVVLPGGFSYGDYLRTGAIARFSPVMNAVVEFAKKGGLVIGICNGFQILLEAGLLPGAMLRNRTLRFECRTVNLAVESARSPFTSAYRPREVIRVPIAHGEGNYYAPPDVIGRLKAEDRILLRYVDGKGAPTDEANPNGSLENIAGIVNERRNVFGLMPHPERASEDALGSSDGRRVFESMIRE
jgi:phosphoribosylformylglycinamidine synthase